MMDRNKTQVAEVRRLTANQQMVGDSTYITIACSFARSTGVGKMRRLVWTITEWILYDSKMLAQQKFTRRAFSCIMSQANQFSKNIEK
jgi:hypothetical protein